MVLRLLESNEDHHLTNHKIVLKVPFKSQLHLNYNSFKSFLNKVKNIFIINYQLLQNKLLIFHFYFKF
jgi:hypothetical protein